MTDLLRNDLLSVKQVAQLLNCSVGTVRNLLKLGKLPCLRFGISDRVVRIHKDDVLSFIDQKRRVTAAQ